METATYLLFAAVIATALHSLMEPMNLKKQLLVLGELMKGGKEKPAGKVNIKPNAVGSALFVIVFMAIVGSITYFVTNAIEPDLEGLILFSAGLLVFVEVANTVGIDRVHAVISSLKDNYR